MSNQAEQLVTLKEASEILRVHPNTLRRWDNEGILQAVRFGERKDRHFRMRDLMEMTAAKKGISPSETMQVDPVSRQDDYQKLLKLSDKITHAAYKFLDADNPETAYTVIIEEANAIIGSDYGSIFLSDNSQLRRIYTSFKVLNKIKPRKIGKTYNAYRTTEPIYYSVKEKSEPHPMLVRLGVKSVLVIPLHCGDQTIGVMNMLFMKKRTFTEIELEQIKSYGAFACIAIKHSQQTSQFRRSVDNLNLFLSVASHEIKNPVSAVYALIQLLELKSRRKEEITPNMLAKLRNEIERISQLVDDFLTSGGPDQYVLEMGNCNLKELIGQALTNFTLQYPSHEIKVRDSVKHDMEIHGDCNKLVQVFVNILNNAGKYSPIDSLISVNLDEDKDNYIVNIKDQGSGISELDKKKIFQKYYRASTTTQGMGLGLYLVKMIVDKHNGSIEITSKTRKGTEVAVKLPKNF